MKRTFWILIAAVAFALPAWSCSCIGPLPACETFWQTPIVFFGHISSVEHEVNQRQEMINGKMQTLVGEGTLRAHITVLETFRGDQAAGQELLLETSDQSSACGIPLFADADYLIFGGKRPDSAIAVGQCSHTHPVRFRDTDVDLLWLRSLAHAPAGSEIFGAITHLLSQAPQRVQPMPQIVVHIAGPVERDATTDGSGKFDLSSLPPGTYRMSVDLPAGLTQEPSRTINVDDKGCAEVDVFTQSDGRIEGDVVTNDGKPITNAFVELQAVASRGPGFMPPVSIVFGEVDAQGHFKFEPVAAGQYLLGINATLPPMDTSHYSDLAQYPAVITLGDAQQLSGLHWVVPPAPGAVAVHVRILDAGGAPVANPILMWWRPDWDTDVGPKLTPLGNGEYTFDAFADRYYSLSARTQRTGAPPECSAPVGLTPAPGQSPLTLTVTAGEPCDLRLAPGASQPAAVIKPGRFTPAQPLANARRFHTVTALRDGRVLVAGGIVLQQPALMVTDAELYDPATQRWQVAGPLQQPREEQTATLLADDRVLLAGGLIQENGRLTETASAEIYDPKAGTFTRTGDMMVARARHTATLLQDGRVLVVGPGRAAEVYDPATGKFAAAASALYPTDGGAAVRLRDGRVLVTGGHAGAAEVFDPVSATFTPTGDLNVRRSLATATLLADGRVLVAGGMIGERPPLATTGTAELYDPTTGTFTFTDGLNWPRFRATALLLHDGRVLVAGGTDATQDQITAELYDPANRTFRVVFMRSPRSAFGAALLPDGSALLIGGAQGQRTLNEVEIYRPQP